MARTRKIIKNSVHRALNTIGDRWSQLIIQEAFRGATRYEEFRARTGAPALGRMAVTPPRVVGGGRSRKLHFKLHVNDDSLCRVRDTIRRPSAPDGALRNDTEADPCS